MKRIEDYIQFQCAQWLRENDILFFHVPNGGNRSKSEGARFKAMGVLAGVPDLVILLPNAVTLFIELKTKKGSLSKAQKLLHPKIKTLGFHLEVIQTDCHQTAIQTLKALVEHHMKQNHTS